MTKKDWILAVSTLLYSYLFYKQSAGINFFLFNIILLAFMLLLDRQALRNSLFLAGSIGALVSSFFIFYYSSALAVTANVFSLALVSAGLLRPRVSAITGVVHTIVVAGGSWMFMIFDSIERKKKKVLEKVNRPFYVILLLVIVTLVISLVYFFMYRESNPLFLEFTKDINLDFISITWIFFTLGGFLLLYGFYYNRRIGLLSWFDDRDPVKLTPAIAEQRTISWLKTDTEFLSGLMLLIMLNGLLLIVNVLDLNYLWFDGTLPEGIKHKEFVHKGVGMLITSILLAIIILLFYFRGLLNFYHKSRPLRLLAYLWIVQNIFMIFSTAYRNNMYITESGLSYKKIGVYVYLILACIGLITTFYKLWKTKSNWSLVRCNAFIMYCLLVIGCTINWDVIITSFNIEKSKDPARKLEKYYLADIGFKNLPQLLTLPDSVVNTDDYPARDYYYASRDVYFENFRTAIHNKLFRFMLGMHQDGWQSYCLEKKRVFDEVLELEKQQRVDSLDLQYFREGMGTLKPISMFTSLRYLNIKNNRLEDAGELAYFPRLQHLDLGGSQVDSLEKFPALKELKEIDVSGTGANDLLFLGGCTALERLHVRNAGAEIIDSVPGFDQLKLLTLEGTRVKSFMPLEKFRQLEDLRVARTFPAHIDTFPFLPNLRRLDISDNRINFSQTALFAALGKLKTLEFLDISNDSIKNLYVLTDHYLTARSYGDAYAPVKGEQVVPNFPALKTLYASNCQLRSLVSCTPFTSLTDLHLNGNYITDITPLTGLKSLTQLHLANNSINNIVALEALSGLKHLNLSHNPVKDITALKGLKQLVHLDLSDCSISDIAALADLTRLHTLNLHNNYFTDITALKALRSLKVLFLGGNKIKDLSALTALQQLEVLYTGDITQAQYDLLKKGLPKTKIYATIKNETKKH